MDKTAAAREQLVTALDLFLADRSPVSVHTLAGAAQDILERACRLRGVEPFISHIEATRPDKTQGALRRIIYEYRNAFKHFEDDDSDTLARFSDDKNDPILFIAIEDYILLMRRSTIPMQVFLSWYYALYPERLAPHVDRTFATRHFPNVLGLPRAEQKRLAREKIAEASSDPALTSHPLTET